MHSCSIFLTPFCCRVQQQDERTQLSPISLQIVAQGLGLLGICLHRCGIRSRRWSRQCNIYTPTDPSSEFETALFQSRLLFPGAAVCGSLATSLWSFLLGGRILRGKSQGLLFLRASSPSKNNARIMTEQCQNMAVGVRFLPFDLFCGYFCFFSRFCNDYFIVNYLP